MGVICGIYQFNHKVHKGKERGKKKEKTLLSSPER